MSSYIIPIIILLIFAYFWRKEQKRKRLRYIENYTFNPVLIRRVKEKIPDISDKDTTKLFDALRDYFYICSQAQGKMVAMPSEAVDIAWHEFLLFTKEYQDFCNRGIGRFLHHTPTEVMKSKTSAQQGIKRAWRLACLKEGIDPQNPKKLPLLFSIDKLLNIKNGFIYTLNCKSKASGTSSSSCGGYCATDIGCSSSCASGSDGWFSSSDSNASSDSGGGWFSFSSDSGSSCGGSSCGSGCGGS
jgi:hypothetical protein